MENPVADGLLRSRVFGDPTAVSVPDPDAEAARTIGALGAEMTAAGRATLARHVIAVGLGSARADIELAGRAHLMDALAISGERPALLDELAVYTLCAASAGGDAAARAHLLLASQALVDGRFAESAAHLARAAGLARPGSDVAFLEPAMGFALARLTGIGIEGFPARVEPIVAELPLAARGWLALAYLAVGDRAAASAQWDLLRPFAAKTPPAAAEFLVAAVGNVEVAAWLGDVETAQALLELLTPHAGLQVMGSAAAPYEGPVDLAIGRAAWCLGRASLARAHLDAALVQCRALGALPHQAIVHAELARTERSTTRSHAEHLRAARDIARRLGMVPLLESLPGTPDTSPLTVREREVADLVAAGATNAEIARRLFLSERTVENHVRNALQKIGGNSRTALVLWHSEHAGGGGARSPRSLG